MNASIGLSLKDFQVNKSCKYLHWFKKYLQCQCDTVFLIRFYLKYLCGYNTFEGRDFFVHDFYRIENLSPLKIIFKPNFIQPQTYFLWFFIETKNTIIL